MSAPRAVYHDLVRAGLLAAVALLCVDGAGRRAAARGIEPAVRPVQFVRGRPRACLMLHGWITSPADFGDLPQALDEAGWDVYAPLHIGHGTCPADLEGVTADALLDAARARYRHLRERYAAVALVGFSMGGTMAALLAAEDPPARLVLVAPFCGVRHKWYYGLPTRWWHALLSPFLGYVPRPPRLVKVNRPGGRADVVSYNAFPTSAVEALFGLGRRLQADAAVSRLRMPVLLVYSTGDDVCSCAAMRALVDRMPSASKRQVVFERSNHHLLSDYDREEAVAAVAAFLAGDEVR